MPKEYQLKKTAYGKSRESVSYSETEAELTEGNSKSLWFTWFRTYSIRDWFAGQANWHGGVSVVMADTMV